jgi:formylglycine-generating enzyme required for sulfatase activity
MRLILLVFLMWSAAATAETRLALLISNEKYPKQEAGLNLFGPLGKAHRDREQMAEALKKYRFEIIEVLDADKDKMDVALAAFTKKLEESGADSVGVIYFVGHGAEVGGELYLIPTQEKHADDKAIRNRAIKANELIDRLTGGLENGKNQGVRLLILDACRSRIKTRGVNERKVDINAQGALVGFAAASGKEAVDSDDSYTMHLTKQMKLNGHLKIEEVFKKARIELAKASGNNQISLEYGGLLGDFCLDNCQSNPLEKDLKAKEQELADLKQKLAQNTTNPDVIQEVLKRLEAVEKQSGMSGMSSNDGMKGMSGMSEKKTTPKVGETFKDCSDCPEMVVLAGGSFKMGSNQNDYEKPIHEVKIKPFAIGKFEVTLGEFKAFVNAANYSVKKESWCNWDSGKFAENDRQPVQCVSWEDATKYAEWLSKKTAKKYRLPTEAEWEYAARANTSTKWSFGDNESDLKDYAWSHENSDRKTHEVGQKKPNGFGLFDMHGNVWEWTCSDYGKYSENNHLKCSSKNNANKSLRGGSWNINAENCRSSSRSHNSLGFNHYGFRLALFLFPQDS